MAGSIGRLQERCATVAVAQRSRTKKKLDLFQNDRKKYEKIHQTVHKEEMDETHDFKFRELLEEKE